MLNVSSGYSGGRGSIDERLKDLHTRFTISNTPFHGGFVRKRRRRSSGYSGGRGSIDERLKDLHTRFTINNTPFQGGFVQEDEEADPDQPTSCQQPTPHGGQPTSQWDPAGAQRVPAVGEEDIQYTDIGGWGNTFDGPSLEQRIASVVAKPRDEGLAISALRKSIDNQRERGETDISTKYRRLKRSHGKLDSEMRKMREENALLKRQKRMADFVLTKVETKCANLAEEVKRLEGELAVKTQALFSIHRQKVEEQAALNRELDERADMFRSSVLLIMREQNQQLPLESSNEEEEEPPSLQPTLDAASASKEPK